LHGVSCIGKGYLHLGRDLSQKALKARGKRKKRNEKKKIYYLKIEPSVFGNF
jgi:hypothetical protein